MDADVPEPEAVAPERGSPEQTGPIGPTPDPARVDLLPPRVKTRVVELACQAFPQLPSSAVPPALRKFSSFAPARRARLVGRHLLTSLAADEDFREHLATQVRALVPDVVAGLESGAAVDRADLPRTAAVAYLARTTGWEQLLDSAAGAERTVPGAGQPADETARRLTQQLDRARDEARQQRERLRASLDQLRRDNAELRRTLGATRTELKAARADAESAHAQLAAARRDADTAAREAAAETRRLRARIAELEAESAATRRVARDDRDAEVVRLRMLLDTMVDVANGLRRELALPATTGLPADTVPAVEPGTSDVAQLGRDLLASDPTLLRQLLDVPRVHLVVDGYNVSKQAWESSSLEQQRNRLVSGVAGLVSGRGIEATVVFDGADLVHPPVVTSPRGVRVRFSPPGVTADDIIRQLVAAEPAGRPVVVVSTDREVAESVAKLGARSVASAALAAVLGR